MPAIQAHEPLKKKIPPAGRAFVWDKGEEIIYMIYMIYMICTICMICMICTICMIYTDTETIRILSYARRRMRRTP